MTGLSAHLSILPTGYSSNQILVSHDLFNSLLDQVDGEGADRISVAITAKYSITHSKKEDHEGGAKQFNSLICWAIKCDNTFKVELSLVPVHHSDMLIELYCYRNCRQSMLRPL
jgi:hypothetical protein